MPNMRSRARDDLASVDEVKVYDDEGEESPASSENLSEDKIGLVIETEKRKRSHSSGDEDAQQSQISPDECCRLPELPASLQDSLFRPYQSSSSHARLNGSSYSHPCFEAYAHGNSRLPLPPPAHLPGLSQSSLYSLPHASHMLPLYSPDLKDYQKWASVTHYPLHLPFPPLPGGSLSTFNPSGFMAHPALHPPEFSGAAGSQYSHHLDHELNVHQFPGTNDSSRQPFYFAHHLGGHGDRDRIPSPQSPVRKKPAIKKPLNAFMLFMKEMRPKVIEEESIKESAAINQILGRRWHALSQAEQTKYYEMAKKEKELHAKLHPGWSARDNYAIHSKRKRKRDPFSSGFLEGQLEKHGRLSLDAETWYSAEQSDNDKQSMLSTSSIKSADDCDI